MQEASESVQHILGLVRNPPGDRGGQRRAEAQAKAIARDVTVLGGPIDAAIGSRMFRDSRTAGVQLRPTGKLALLVVAQGGVVFGDAYMPAISYPITWDHAAPIRVSGTTLMLASTTRAITAGFDTSVAEQLASTIISVCGQGPLGSDGDSDETVRLSGVYLGGYGSRLLEGQSYALSFTDSAFVAQAGPTEIVRCSLDEVRELDLSGPGAYTTGGGFMGGGFGVKGAAEGIAAATVLNALTTRRHVQTVIRIRWDGGSAFFDHGRFTPGELKIRLSQVIDSLAANQRTPLAPTPDLGDSLAQIASLYEKGLLTEEEYAQAKHRLLDPPD